ncbi:MAG: FGGY-family carbohydrate kinase [Pseudomonadota bacterium]|nr:FGGY-family carbohydrate kinase [Pseudomonadota bacterium]
MPELLLALDAGTTGVRALVIDAAGAVLGTDKQGIATHFPGPGRVEQDAAAVWKGCLQVIDGALAAAGRRVADLAAVGVTTQRASVVLWDRVTGEPVAPMLVWSDLSGMDRHRELRDADFISWPQAPLAKLPTAIAAATESGARARAGELCWGTLDSYLVSRLSAGAAHVTDLSCAWMTGYLNYAVGRGWNDALLAHQALPLGLFPTIVDSWGAIATTAVSEFGAAVPIRAVMADQQAGMIAHGALAKGAWKTTYGTSAVLMAATGAEPMMPHRSMPAEALTSVGGGTRYCLEGMVITAGSLVDWMSDPLGLFASPTAMEAAARSVADTGGAHVRPSLQGLGAPHGRFDARGLIAGLGLGTTSAHIARAALAGIAFRIREIADVVAAVPGLPVPELLPVDGGMTTNTLLLQLQADALGRPVRRHAVYEATAYGVALAAGLGAGLVAETDLRELARYDAEFEPAISRDEADAAFACWRAATQVSARAL